MTKKEQLYKLLKEILPPHYTDTVITEIAEQINEIYVKKKVPQQGDIWKVLNVFYETINPMIKFGHKGQRAAAERLLKKFPFEKIEKMIQFAVSISNNKFAPVITTPYQLEEKLAALVSYKNKLVEGGRLAPVNWKNNDGQPRGQQTAIE